MFSPSLNLFVSHMPTARMIAGRLESYEERGLHVVLNVCQFTRAQLQHGLHFSRTDDKTTCGRSADVIWGAGGGWQNLNRGTRKKGEGDVTQGRKEKRRKIIIQKGGKIGQKGCRIR